MLDAQPRAMIDEEKIIYPNIGEGLTLDWHKHPHQHERVTGKDVHLKDKAPQRKPGETEHSRDHRHRSEFLANVAHAINYSSLENGSNTPDFLLAEFLADVLVAFDRVQQKRGEWYGKPIKAPGSSTDSTPAAPETKESQALDLLLEVRNAVRANPAMQGKEYDGLGQRVVKLLEQAGRL
jgi:hypothetical protein